MRFDVGISVNILMAAAAAIVLSIVFRRSSAASPSKKAESFSVWFHAEPNPPRKNDMKAIKLNRLIGSDYNDDWMSKTPIIAAAENETGAFIDRSKMVRPDTLELPEQLPAQYKDMMRVWLENRGSCSVEYMWIDLGKSFWPRWIKKGRCDRSEMMSCSWPPGMSCMPSSVRVLNLLRWHCWLKNRKNKRKQRGRKMMESAVDDKTAGRAKRDERSGDRKQKKKKDNKFRCLWIKIPYPVTEDCTCSCRKSDE